MVKFAYKVMGPELKKKLQQKISANKFHSRNSNSTNRIVHTFPPFLSQVYTVYNVEHVTEVLSTCTSCRNKIKQNFVIYFYSKFHQTL